MKLQRIMRITTKSIERGFTLVELLVVIAIIAILTGFITTAVYNGRIEARDLARKSDIQQLRLAIKLYKDSYDQYPEYPGGTEIGVGNPIDEQLRPFIQTVSADPLAEAGGGGEYAYWYDSEFDCGNTHVVVLAEFEANKGNYALDCGPLGAHSNPGDPSFVDDPTVQTYIGIIADISERDE